MTWLIAILGVVLGLYLLGMQSVATGLMAGGGIELRCTHIRTGDGRDVYIPSSQIFNEPLVNFTRDGLRRLSFVVGVVHADETEHARRVLLEAVRGANHVLQDPAPAVSVSALLPQYQELEVSFWVDVFKPDVSIGLVRWP